MDAISILLVDENPTFLRIVAHLLREYYHEEVTLVGTSAGDEDALHQVQRLKPRVVMIGMDLQSRQGLRLIPQLRMLIPGVKIIVSGPLDMPSCRQSALDMGADGFIAKAALHTELLSTIRRTTGTTPTSRYQSWQRAALPVLEIRPLASY